MSRIARHVLLKVVLAVKRYFALSAGLADGDRARVAAQPGASVRDGLEVNAELVPPPHGSPIDP